MRATEDNEGSSRSKQKRCPGEARIALLRPREWCPLSPPGRSEGRNRVGVERTHLEWERVEQTSNRATGAAWSITAKWETTGKLRQFNYIQLDLLASVHTERLLNFTAFPRQRRTLERRGLALFRNAQQRLPGIQYEAFNFREVDSGVVYQQPRNFNPHVLLMAHRSIEHDPSETDPRYHNRFTSHRPAPSVAAVPET